MWNGRVVVVTMRVGCSARLLALFHHIMVCVSFLFIVYVFFLKISQINLSLAYSRHAVPLLQITYLQDIGMAIRWSAATTSTVAVASANFTLNAETLQCPFQYYTSCYFSCWYAMQLNPEFSLVGASGISLEQCMYLLNGIWPILDAATD